MPAGPPCASPLPILTPGTVANTSDEEKGEEAGDTIDLVGRIPAHPLTTTNPY